MSMQLPEMGLTQPSGREVLSISAAQLGANNLTATTTELPRGENRIYQMNEKLWQDLIDGHLQAATSIILEKFWLSQWLPLRPGLFHTRNARMNRERARRYLLTGPGASERAAAEFKSIFGRSVPRSLRQYQNSPTYIYHPYGKGLMLEGGVGCIRLKPKRLADGELWFMGASSEPVAHQGIPVAVPDDIYGRIVDHIASSGSLQCTLKGRLKLVPPDLDPLYSNLVGIPQVYLLVESITHLHTRRDYARFLAEGAVMVATDSNKENSGSFYGGTNGIYSAYASFDPGVKDSIDVATAWLSDAYASDLLRGKILTDFDEQVHRFKGVKFSLENIMIGQISESETEELLRRCGVRESRGDCEKIERMMKERVITINGSNNILAIDGGIAAGTGGVAIGHSSAVAYSGGLAAAGGGSAVSRGSTSPIDKAGLIEHARASRWVKVFGVICLAATAAATVLLVLHVTDIGVAGYLVAVLAIVVGIIPLLRSQNLQRVRTAAPPGFGLSTVVLGQLRRSLMHLGCRRSCSVSVPPDAERDRQTTRSMRVEVWVASPEPAVGVFTPAGTCPGRLRRHCVIGCADPGQNPPAARSRSSRVRGRGLGKTMARPVPWCRPGGGGDGYGAAAQRRA